MDCEQLQSVQNLEYLPSEDELWIIDSGRINDEPVCRPKLVVWSVGRKEVGGFLKKIPTKLGDDSKRS